MNALMNHFAIYISRYMSELLDYPLEEIKIPMKSRLGDTLKEVIELFGIMIGML